MPHEKCTCGKPVGHGRHYPGPFYYCECGFHSSRRADLERHLKQTKLLKFPLKASNQKTLEVSS